MLRSILAITFVLSAVYAQDPQRFRFEQDRSSPGTFSVRVMNEGRETVYRVQREQFRDAAPPPVHLFGNGSLFLMDGYAGVLEYYGGTATMTSRYLIRGAVKPDHERVIAWSGTPSRIALTISEPNEESVLVLLFDDRGTLLLTTSLQDRVHASSVVLSTDGSLLSAGTYRWEGTSPVYSIDFLQTNGTILASGAAEMKKGVFSTDLASFLATGASSAAILEVSTGRVVSSRHLEPGSVIHDALWEGSVAVIAASPKPAFEERRWVYPSLTLFTLSHDKAPTTLETITGSFRNAQLKREGTTIVIDIDGRPLKRD